MSVEYPDDVYGTTLSGNCLHKVKIYDSGEKVRKSTRCGHTVSDTIPKEDAGDGWYMCSYCFADQEELEEEENGEGFIFKIESGSKADFSDLSRMVDTLKSQGFDVVEKTGSGEIVAVDRVDFNIEKIKESEDISEESESSLDSKQGGNSDKEEDNSYDVNKDVEKFEEDDKTTRQEDEEFREKVIEDYKSGTSINELKSKYDVSNSFLYDDLRLDEIDRDLECSYCGKPMETISGLRTHEKHCDDEEDVDIDYNEDTDCRYCGKDCGNPGATTTHEKHCPDNPDYNEIEEECPRCGKRVYRRQDGIIHCSNCNKEFEDVDQLKKEEREEDDDEDEFVCGDCGESFETSGDLRVHRSRSKDHDSTEPMGEGSGNESADVEKEKDEDLECRYCGRDNFENEDKLSVHEEVCSDREEDSEEESEDDSINDSEDSNKESEEVDDNLEEEESEEDLIPDKRGVSSPLFGLEVHDKYECGVCGEEFDADTEDIEAREHKNEEGHEEWNVWEKKEEEEEGDE